MQNGAAWWFLISWVLLLYHAFAFKVGVVRLGHKKERLMVILQQGVFTVAQINGNLSSISICSSQRRWLICRYHCSRTICTGKENGKFLTCLPLHKTLLHKSKVQQLFNSTVLKQTILLADFFIYKKICKHMQKDRMRKLCTLLFSERK